MQAIEQFREVIRAAGLQPPDVIEPGKFHKFPGEGKRNGNAAAWCKLFPDGVGGIYGDFSTGLSADWQANRETPFTPAEREAFRHQVAEAKAQAEADKKAKEAEAATKATAIWNAAADAPADAPADHPYQRAKGVKAHGLRVTDDGKLIVPMRIGTEVHSVQFIDQNGDKRFLSGGRTKGCYFLIGTAAEAKEHGVILCEGYATGATLREATGMAVVVCFTAGNLLDVAVFIREKLGADVSIIIAGDFDKSGTGQKAATQAAQAVGGLVALPPFTEAELAVENPPSDWNDYTSLHSPLAVKQAIKTVLRDAKKDELVSTHSATETNAPAGDIAGDNRIIVVSILDFLNRDIPPRERILAPWLLTQSLNMVYAWRGVGKTHVALGIAYASASGGTFLKWKASKSCRVLYIDGEMPAASMQDRLRDKLVADVADFDPDYFRLITPDLQTGAMPDLATAEGQDEIDAVLGDTELIVIDNLSCLARSGGRENDAESWLPIQPWALRQRQQGRSVLFVHHSGKNGAQRGTSKREDILDTVMTLKRPSDYNPADGAVFEVHFEKTRDMHGDEAAPFEARLQTDAMGQSAWTFNSVEDSTFDRVVSLANEGLSQKEIAEELDINKSNVSRHIRRATDAGLIQKGGKRDPF